VVLASNSGDLVAYTEYQRRRCHCSLRLQSVAQCPRSFGTHSSMPMVLGSAVLVQRLQCDACCLQLPRGAHPAWGWHCIGSSTQRIVSGSLEELLTVDFGPPLHSLVIVGDLHELELRVPEALQVDR